MGFDVKNKVALITGGAQGLGFAFAEEFLKNGIKGITIADLDSETGATAVTELNKKYGNDKVIFVETDVTDMNKFESAFQKTVEVFKHVDILINNAGTADDSKWRKLIDININGVIHGMLLGIDNYLKNFKSTDEALIINLCSIASLQSFPRLPIYGLSKFAIMGMVKSWGSPEHFHRTRVRVFGICPGFTDTNLLKNPQFLGPAYEEMASSSRRKELQSSEFLAKELLKIIPKASNGSLWVVENEEPAYEYIFTPRETYKPNC